MTHFVHDEMISGGWGRKVSLDGVDFLARADPRHRLVTLKSSGEHGVLDLTVSCTKTRGIWEEAGYSNKGSVGRGRPAETGPSICWCTSVKFQPGR